MKDYCSLVNSFLGCDPTDLPKRRGIAAAWNPIKGLCGNTSPEAVLPFSKMSCCAYSGAYPTGYGICSVNSHRPIKPMFPYNRFCGFTHLRPSGTGFIDYFYNYALVTPTLNAERILSESARPGYYSCVTNTGLNECTVTADCAFHRFTFTKESGEITVDFSQYGLKAKRPDVKTNPDAANCYISNDTVICSTSFYGVPVHFAVRAKNAKSVSLFDGDDKTVKKIEHDICNKKFGATFTFEKTAETVLSLSFLSAEHALELLNRDFNDTFDDVSKKAYSIWNDMLSRIDVSGNADDEKLFYTNLYFCLVKPADVSGERLYGFDGDAVVDVATMWDMYKTEIPLLFAVYPEIGEKLISTIISFYDKHGFLPNSYLIHKTQSLQSKQAKFLTSHIFADALYYGIGNKKETYRVLLSEFNSDAFSSFKRTHTEERITQALDLFEGEICLAELAESNEDIKFANELRSDYKHISSAYSKNGLLKRRSKYYEGNFINYSFRLHSDEQMRINAAGGKEKLTKLLDYFFGYRLKAIKFGKFEGFNNETDMETPYLYHYVDRHDRISEIIDASRKYMWTNTRGGMPGNNDTGALSSLYVWNALGLFPVSGQNRLIVGLPLFKSANIKINDKLLTINTEGEGIYANKIVVNGIQKPRLECTVGELTAGGKIVIYMQKQPK